MQLDELQIYPDLSASYIFRSLAHKLRTSTRLTLELNLQGIEFSIMSGRSSTASTKNWARSSAGPAGCPLRCVLGSNLSLPLAFELADIWFCERGSKRRWVF